MFKEFMASVDLTFVPIIALLLFFTVFMGVLIWTHRKGSKRLYNDVANEALNDGKLAANASGVSK